MKHGDPWGRDKMFFWPNRILQRKSRPRRKLETIAERTCESDGVGAAAGDEGDTAAASDGEKQQLREMVVVEAAVPQLPVCASAPAPRPLRRLLLSPSLNRRSGRHNRRLHGCQGPVSARWPVGRGAGRFSVRINRVRL